MTDLLFIYIVAHLPGLAWLPEILDLVEREHRIQRARRALRALSARL